MSAAAPDCACATAADTDARAAYRQATSGQADRSSRCRSPYRQRSAAAASSSGATSTTSTASTSRTSRTSRTAGTARPVVAPAGNAQPAALAAASAGIAIADRSAPRTGRASACLTESTESAGWRTGAGLALAGTPVATCVTRELALASATQHQSNNADRQG